MVHQGDVAVEVVEENFKMLVLDTVDYLRKLPYCHWCLHFQLNCAS